MQACFPLYFSYTSEKCLGVIRLTRHIHGHDWGQPHQLARPCKFSISVKIQKLSTLLVFLILQLFFHACKDEYNNDVKREAKPMPVEYLISDMNVTMPKDQKHTWANANKEVSFPIENRSHSSQQTFESFCRYLKHFCGDSVSQGMLQQKFKEIFSNFHIFRDHEKRWVKQNITDHTDLSLLINFLCLSYSSRVSQQIDLLDLN